MNCPRCKKQAIELWKNRERPLNAVEALLTDTLISEQVYARPPSLNLFEFTHRLCIYSFPQANIPESGRGHSEQVAGLTIHNFPLLLSSRKGTRKPNSQRTTWLDIMIETDSTTYSLYSAEKQQCNHRSNPYVVINWVDNVNWPP